MNSARAEFREDIQVRHFARFIFCASLLFMIVGAELATAMRSLERCRIALLGGTPGGSPNFMTEDEARALHKLYDDPGVPTGDQRARAFKIWRRARLRSLGLLYGRRVFNAYQMMPERHNYGYTSDAHLEVLSEEPLLRDSIFGLMDDIHDLEHRIQILTKLGRLTSPERDIDVEFRARAFAAEHEVAAVLPPAAFAGAPIHGLDDEKLRAVAQSYVASWAGAGRRTRLEFATDSPRAKIPFAPQGRLANRARVFGNSDLSAPGR